MGGSLAWVLHVMVCARSLLERMTSKPLPASLGLGMCGRKPRRVWSAFQEGFLLGDAGSPARWFSLF